MLFHILKKDLMKRKGINAILFIFITLATVFLASSVNNIMAVTSAVDYYMEYANVPSVNVILNSTWEKETIDTWLNEQQASGSLNEYAYNTMIGLPNKSLYILDGEEQTLLDGNGASFYLGTTDVDYTKVFDKDGNEFTLQDNEIAVSISIMNRNHLQVGDVLRLYNNGQEKDYTIKQSMKDAAYGNDMMGMVRFIVNEKEYDSMQKGENALGLYYISSDQPLDMKQSFTNQSFASVLNIVDQDMYKMIYSFDMIMAALLILIGVCLILIALLVLRFTLVFTMEEQYQEIGILKAVGLRNWSIKKLYLMKYAVLVLSGAMLGVLCSIPVSTFMVKSVSSNMIMESSSANFFVNIISAIIVVCLVLAFCYFCTRKLNKVSAITAIRGGNSGERYHKRKGIYLSKQTHMPVSLYLGLNDILCSVRRYAVLIITFCISFILITIPLNTVNTMQSEEMVEKFAINPESTILVNNIEERGESVYNNSAELDQGLKRLKSELRTQGYDAQLTALSLYFFSFTKSEADNKENLLSIQIHGDIETYLTYSEGSAPTLENEIAFSKKVLNEHGWTIGDRVKTQIDGKEKEFIITGTYSDYMQLGSSARFSSNLDLSQEPMFDYNNIMVKFDTELNKEEIKTKLISQFPEYKWTTPQEFVDQSIGGVQQMVDSILLPITAMLCGVIMLITLLMERLFITREKGEIAMMKSIGFTKHTIRSWQLIRMISVVFASMLISIPLSLLSNQILLKPIFSIMGADVAIQVKTWDAYVLYPGVLLIGIIVATLLATTSIRNINIREINNLE